MGYESKLLVVEPYRNLSLRDGKTYAGIIATIDLCVMPRTFRDAIGDHWQDDGYYFYEGDYAVTTDCYGDPLVAADLPTAIADLREADEAHLERNGERYRRILPAIALLEGFDQSQWDELLVLHYGH